MSENSTAKANFAEMLSFGGVQFAASTFMAFSAYYLLMFFTDVAMLPAAVTAGLLFCLRILGAIDDQVVSLFINRMSFKGGKYRPYLKWSALPFTLSMAALGLTPGIGMGGRVLYAALMLFICELSWSTSHTATMAMLPYLARDDISRTRFVSFSNGSSIIAYIIVGTFMLPLTELLGGGSMFKGFALTLALLALIAAPLYFNAYIHLRERHYIETEKKPYFRDMYLAILRNKRIMLFMTGFCLYSMADAFKSLTTYYYVTYNMARPDLLPLIILAGLLSPLAVQPFMPRLLQYAKKETLITAGLFTAAGVCLLMLAAGRQPAALIVCVLLYGVCTAIVANLVFTMMAAFSDEIRSRQHISMSELLTATVGLSSKLGVAISSGVAPIMMAAFGYSAQAATQSAGALTGIRTLYILCTATGLAIAGLVMLLFSNTLTDKAIEQQ